MGFWLEMGCDEAWTRVWIEEMVAHFGLEGRAWVWKRVGGVGAYRWRLSLLEFHNSFAYIFAFSRFVTQAFEVTSRQTASLFAPRRPHYAERQPPTRLDQRHGVPTWTQPVISPFWG
jgi:hypothetical protein